MRTQRVCIAQLHEYFSLDCINLLYEATHRQCADIYTKGFHEPGKWYAVCLLVNIVDGDKLAELLTRFTRHNDEREQEEILSHVKELKETKKRTPHEIAYYTAAPSVQRRGVSQSTRTPNADTSDICDDLNLRFDDLPLHEEGGEFTKDPDRAASNDEANGRTAYARSIPSVLVTPSGMDKTLKTIHGTLLIELDPKRSIVTLKFLEYYDWPHDDISDIGLTYENIVTLKFLEDYAWPHDDIIDIGLAPESIITIRLLEICDWHHDDITEDQYPASRGAQVVTMPSATVHAFQQSSSLLEEVAKRLLLLSDGSDDEDTPKRKELDSVKVPTWPSIATYRDWTTQLTRNVNTAANRFDDDSIAWLRATFEVGTTFEQFYECPKEFITLDRKLAKSLSEIIPKFLKDRITNKETAYHMKGQ